MSGSAQRPFTPSSGTDRPSVRLHPQGNAVQPTRAFHESGLPNESGKRSEGQSR